MKKPALLAFLCICASASIADAQTAATTAIVPRPVSAAEIEWTAAGSALIVLAVVIAIVRGRRRG